MAGLATSRRVVKQSRMDLNRLRGAVLGEARRTWLSGSSSTSARGFTVAPSSSSTRVPRRWSSSPRGAVGACDASLPCELDDLGGAVGTLSSEAVGVGCEAFGEDDSGPVFEWGDVFGTHTDKGLAVRSEQGASDSTRRGVSPNVPKSPVSRTVRCSRGSLAGLQGGAVRHHALAVGAYHQEGFRDDAVDLQLRREPPRRHTVVASHVTSSQAPGGQRGAGQDRDMRTGSRNSGVDPAAWTRVGVAAGGAVGAGGGVLRNCGDGAAALVVTTDRRRRCFAAIVVEHAEYDADDEAGAVLARDVGGLAALGPRGALA